MTDFANAVEAVSDAIGVLNTEGKAHEGDLPELLSGIELSPDVFAQILLEHLPIVTMEFANKAYWLEVAEYMGPEGIRAFRHVGSFMERVAGF